jgi:CheY-like chemotaxis protein
LSFYVVAARRGVVVRRQKKSGASYRFVCLFFNSRVCVTCGERIIARVKENKSLQSAAAEGAARGRRRLRILVADDERDQVMTLAMILQDEGHEVREVYRGAEVLRMVREFDPDVALIDIGMPGMSGYDVAREVRQEFGKQRPVLVAVTGWKQASDKILARLAGFDHHVAKPFESKALLELIEPLASSNGK